LVEGPSQFGNLTAQPLQLFFAVALELGAKPAAVERHQQRPGGQHADKQADDEAPAKDSCELFHDTGSHRLQSSSSSRRNRSTSPISPSSDSSSPPGSSSSPSPKRTRSSSTSGSRRSLDAKSSVSSGSSVPSSSSPSPAK